MSNTIIDKLNQIQQIKDEQTQVLQNAGIDLEGKTYSDFPALFGEQIQEKEDLSTDIEELSATVQDIISSYIKNEDGVVKYTNTDFLEFSESLNKLDLQSTFIKGTSAGPSATLYTKVYLSANTMYKYGCFSGTQNSYGKMIRGYGSLSSTTLMNLPNNWATVSDRTLYEFSTSALTADGWYYFFRQLGNANFDERQINANWLFVPSSVDVVASSLVDDDFVFYRDVEFKPDFIGITNNDIKPNSLDASSMAIIDNAFIKPKLSNGSWPNNDPDTFGVWVSNANMKGDSKFYKVEPGANYYYYNDAPGVVWVYFYEYGYQISSHGDITADGIQHKVRFTRVGDTKTRFLTVPSNAHYVRFGTKKETVTDNMMFIRCNSPAKIDQPNTSKLKNAYVIEDAGYKPLQGAKIVYDGDSIIAQTSTHQYISTDLGVQELSTIAAGGNTIASLATQSHVDQIPLDTDIVLVVIGTNDSTASSTRPLGDLSSTHDTTTFCGAYQLYLDMVFTRVPTATVVIVTPPFKKDEDTTTTPEGKSLEDYREAIRHIAVKYACPIVDLKQSMSVNQVNYGWFSADGTHYATTTAGAFRMARAISPVLKNIGYYGTYIEFPTPPLSTSSITYYKF